MSRNIPGPATATSRSVPGPKGRLHVTDQPGQGPPLVLLHGFPDDSRIYDRLLPLLTPRRVLALDWLGYGRSERAAPGPIDPSDHARSLGAVLDSLELAQAVLVGHDASGPDAVDFALTEPGRVAHLILLNTYYGHAPVLRLPELIRLLADPEFAPLADAMMGDPAQRRWLLAHTATRFGLTLGEGGVGTVSLVPQFFGAPGQADALAAIRAWTGALYSALDEQDGHIAAGHLAALDLPVTLVFGARDEYLNPDLARRLAGLFGDAELHLVEDASHWPQWDQPERVARLIDEALSASRSASRRSPQSG
jgi:pimeloyl-ACP methyl ester carboxylesterase